MENTRAVLHVDHVRTYALLPMRELCGLRPGHTAHAGCWMPLAVDKVITEARLHMHEV